MKSKGKIYETIGMKISSIRVAANKTQSDLAKDVDLSRTSIVNIESGNQKLLIDKLYDIAIALNKEINDFLPPVSILNDPIDSYSRDRFSDSTQKKLLDIIKKTGEVK